MKSGQAYGLITTETVYTGTEAKQQAQDQDQETVQERTAHYTETTDRQTRQ